MNDLATSERGQLPATLNALNQFIIIGKERLNAQKAKIRAIEKTNMAVEAKEAALSDAQDMADILLDAEVKLGEILENRPEEIRSSQGGTSKPLPPDISKRASHQAQTLSQHRDVIEQVKAEARESGEIPTANHVYKLIKSHHVSHNSGENEWYTPPEYIEAARIVLGGQIDLDPASSVIANRLVKAETFYTKETDGLNKHWSGNVWMNPPYASDLIRQFTSKFAHHVIEGDIKTGIVLVNNATETAWFRELINCANAVLFTTGRIKYLDAQGNPKNTPLQGQAFIYFGEKPLAFLFEFKKFGWGFPL